MDTSSAKIEITGLGDNSEFRSEQEHAEHTELFRRMISHAIAYGQQIDQDAFSFSQLSSHFDSTAHGDEVITVHISDKKKAYSALSDHLCNQIDYNSDHETITCADTLIENDKSLIFRNILRIMSHYGDTETAAALLTHKGFCREVLR